MICCLICCLYVVWYVAVYSSPALFYYFISFPNVLPNRNFWIGSTLVQNKRIIPTRSYHTTRELNLFLQFQLIRSLWAVAWLLLPVNLSMTKVNHHFDNRSTAWTWTKNMDLTNFIKFQCPENWQMLEHSIRPPIVLRLHGNWIVPINLV